VGTLNITLHKTNLVIIFLITLLFYGYFIRPGDWNIDSRFALVKAIVEEGRLTIDSYEFETGDKAYINGHYYSDKAIGASILGALVYLPFYEINGGPLPLELFTILITFFAVSVPTALLSPMFYSLALRITGKKWLALILTLCISLTTPLFPYAGAFYGHSLAATIAFSVFFLWVEVNQFEARITPARLFASGFLIGFMIITEYTTIMIAMFLMGYIIYIALSKQMPVNSKNIGCFLVGGAIPLIVLLSYNWICFGSPLSLGYSHEYLEKYRDFHNTGIMGFSWPNAMTLLYMTIHPMQGIFLQSPILLFAIPGFVMMKWETKFRVELIFCTLTILVYFLAVSSLDWWWGGDAFAARHLIPVLPFFGMALISAAKKYLPFLISLGLVSFFQMLVASATLYHSFNIYSMKILSQPFTLSWENSLLYRELLRKLLHNTLVYSWGHYFFGLESWYFNFSIPILSAIILIIVFYFVNRRESDLSVQMPMGEENNSI
jgi:hypothetical protein